MAPSPPFALRSLTFRFPALAALAGRTPMGGQREVALATYVVARLAQDTLPDRGLTQPSRAERATAAKTWLSSITLPAPVRPPLQRALEASAEDAGAIAAAVRSVMAVTANYLDSGARSEVAQLAGMLDAQALVEQRA